MTHLPRRIRIVLLFLQKDKDSVYFLTISRFALRYPSYMPCNTNGHPLSTCTRSFCNSVRSLNPSDRGDFIAEIGTRPISADITEEQHDFPIGDSHLVQGP